MLVEITGVPEIVSQIGNVRLEAVEVEAFQVVYVNEQGQTVTSPLYLNYTEAVANFARRAEEADRG